MPTHFDLDDHARKKCTSNPELVRQNRTSSGKTCLTMEQSAHIRGEKLQTRDPIQALCPTRLATPRYTAQYIAQKTVCLRACNSPAHSKSLWYGLNLNAMMPRAVRNPRIAVCHRATTPYRPDEVPPNAVIAYSFTTSPRPWWWF